MTQFDTVMIAEGAQDATEEEFFAAVQSLIDSGLVWQLQGFFGRLATTLIEDGHCTVAET